MQTAEITELQEAIKEWKKHNISRCEMEFSCGGDSMNDTQFSFYDKNDIEIDNELLWDFFNDEVYKFIPSVDNPSETPETNRLSAYTARNAPEIAPKSIIDPEGTFEVSIWVQFICCNAM